MGAVGEAVKKRARTSFNRARDATRDNDRAERRIAARHSFAEKNDVGRNAPMIDGKGFAGAAYSGHHFVGDQKDFVAAAYSRDAGHVMGGARRRRESRRRWARRERRDAIVLSVCEILVESVIELRGARDDTLGIMQV